MQLTHKLAKFKIETNFIDSKAEEIDQVAIECYKVPQSLKVVLSS